MITTTLSLHLLLAAAAGPSTLAASTTGAHAVADGTRIKIGAGSKHGVEVGDHGRLLDGTGTVTRFTILAVSANGSEAFVPLRQAEVDRYKSVEIELTPGTTPKKLTSKDIGGGSLGSCASGYTMYKNGHVTDWSESNGVVTSVVIEQLGWKHRVCGDSTGLIYEGGVGDVFVTDDADRKIRLRITTLGYRSSTAEVIQGTLTPADLEQNTLVVFRAKK